MYMYLYYLVIYKFTHALPDFFFSRGKSYNHVICDRVNKRGVWAYVPSKKIFDI